MNNEYPKEDKCKYCGEHIGWALNEMAEAFMLQDCGTTECLEARKHETKTTDPTKET